MKGGGFWRLRPGKRSALSGSGRCGLAAHDNRHVAQCGEHLLRHIFIRDAAPKIHQLFLAAVDHPVPGIVDPLGRILEDMEHLGPRRAGRIGNNQLLQALPVDTAGRYGDPLPGDRRVFAQPSAEDGGPLLGQPFAGCRRAVGAGAAPQQNPQFGHLGEFVRARESFGPGFEDPAVVADRRIDHGAALPEIDVVRIGLRLRFRTREKSQGAHQGAHPYLVQ